MTITRTTDQGPCTTATSASFLSLPTELRLEIYKHLFHPDSSKILITDRTGGGGYANKQLKPRHKTWPILLTCRAMYDEAFAYYWSRSRVHVYTTWRQLLRDPRSPLPAGALSRVEYIHLRLYTLNARWAEILDGLINPVQLPKLRTLVVREDAVALEPAHFQSLVVNGNEEAQAAAAQEFYEEEYLPLVCGGQNKKIAPFKSSSWDLLGNALTTFPRNKVVCVPLVMDRSAESISSSETRSHSCVRKVLVCNLGNGKVSLVPAGAKSRGIQDVLD